MTGGFYLFSSGACVFATRSLDPETIPTVNPAGKIANKVYPALLYTTGAVQL